MSGHRDDGTFAENKAHHPNRKVGKGFRMQGPYSGNKYTMAEIHPELYNDIDDSEYRDSDREDQSYKGIDPAEMS